MSKILYGQVHNVSDFDKITRIKGTKTHIASKGKEWFMLSSNFRVIGIYESKESAIADYCIKRYFKPGQTLHNIISFNKGRCSIDKCKEIFKDWV